MVASSIWIMETANIDPVIKRHRDLEEIALVALDAARLLVESGARSRVARNGATFVARGLGAERVYVRIGFTSIGITVGAAGNSITRMMGIGPHGVNLRLDHAVCLLCGRIAKGEFSVSEAAAAIVGVQNTPRHHWLSVAFAVGLACTSFGLLLGMDWLAVLPVFLSGTVGQIIRYRLLRAGVNAFVTTAVVAFVASAGGGIGGHLIASQTIQTAMFASVLLLVPGVPLLNAQTDVMEGHPTMGSARAISAIMVLVFITVGVWCAQAVTGTEILGHFQAPHQHAFVVQMLSGAAAAFGFGMLFNFGWSTLACTALMGAVALSVRTLGLSAGWTLPTASFAASVAVGLGVWVMTHSPARFTRAGTVLGVAACIPMVPGSAASHAILGLFALTDLTNGSAPIIWLSTVRFGLQAFFTVGAIGAGLTIVASLLHSRDFWNLPQTSRK